MPSIVRYLLLVRCLVITGGAAGLTVLVAGFGLSVPWWPPAVITAGLGLASAAAIRGARSGRFGPAYLTVQLVIDVVAIAAFVFFSGGSINPLISLLVLPVVFAAATLPPAATAAIAGCAVFGYTLLMFFHLPLTDHAGHVSGAALHLWGMWYGFVLSAVCITVLVARMASGIRRRDAALARAREEALKAERLVELGALAAGTAHELGTPLATIAVLAADLETETADADARYRIGQVREAVARCKDSLSRLAADAGQFRADSGSAEQLDEYLENLIDDWRRARPGVAVVYEARGPRPAPTVVADRTLGQAIVNILNNAADATALPVKVLGEWRDQSLRLTVSDDGPGIDAAVVARAGAAPVDGGAGLGIGLYLAIAALKRIGGSVEFERPSRGGTVARLSVPLHAVAAT